MDYQQKAEAQRHRRAWQQELRLKHFLGLVPPVGEEVDDLEEVGLLRGVTLYIRRFALDSLYMSGPDAGALAGPVARALAMLPDSVLRRAQGIALRRFLRSLPRVDREEAPGNRPVASFGDLEIWAPVPPRGWKTYFVAVRTLRKENR